MFKSAFMRVAVLLGAFLLVCGGATAWAVGASENVQILQGGQGVSSSNPLAVNAGSADPCLNPNIAKSSKTIGVTNSTGLIANAVSGEKIYVCKIDGVASGTTPAIQIEYGTQTTNPCDTNTTAMTGLMAPTSGTAMSFGAGMSTPVSNAVCALVNGSSSAGLWGVMTYVQQ